MAKLSVQSRWFGSLLAFVSALAFASGTLPVRLEQDDLYRPAVISAWLKANGATADKALAEEFFEAGVKAKKRGAKGDWGPAVKSFCASALYYPAPKTLIECAEVQLQSLGASRRREKTVAQFKRSDMTSIEAIYRSALAADTVLNTLSPAEKKGIRQNADCLSAFNISGKVAVNCQPLQTYGLTK